MTKNSDLKSGMKIVIPAGDTLMIREEVYPSRISPGFLVAETEIGPLYLAGDLSTKVVVTDETAAADTFVVKQ
ncbi:hypothetical protein ARTHROSP310_28450 [Arthrobacter sp. AD-310]